MLKLRRVFPVFLFIFIYFCHKSISRMVIYSVSTIHKALVPAEYKGRCSNAKQKGIGKVY